MEKGWGRDAGEVGGMWSGVGEGCAELRACRPKALITGFVANWLHLGGGEEGKVREVRGGHGLGGGRFTPLELSPWDSCSRLN